MATFDVVSQKGEKLRTIELSDEVFATEVKPYLFWEVVTAQLANRRSGSANSKTRSEVRGGGRKPYRQKGTGRARQGSIRSYHWVGGGVCHGPKPRDWSQATPKKVRRGALRCAISKRVLDKSLVIVDSLSLEAVKTKQVTGLLKALGITGKALLVEKHGDDVNHVSNNLALSARNLPHVGVLPPGGLNVYDVLRHDHLVLTEEAAKWIEGAFTR